jgi:hypothetical protein
VFEPSTIILAPGIASLFSASTTNPLMDVCAKAMLPIKSNRVHITFLNFFFVFIFLFSVISEQAQVNILSNLEEIIFC